MKLVRSLILLGFAMVGGLTLSAHADQTPTEAVRPAALTMPEDCTWESARALSVEQISGDYLALYGQCVRTRGISDGDSIGPDEATFRRVNWAHLGVMFQNERVPRGTFTDAEFLGVVGACEYVCPPVDEQITRIPTAPLPLICAWARAFAIGSRKYPYLLASEFRAVDPRE